jgi:predicted membrane-bound spermidine synthase
VAKKQRGGLQNRYARVRIPPWPPVQYIHAGVTELVDVQDLKSWEGLKTSCGFDSHPRHMDIPFVGKMYWSRQNGLILCTRKDEIFVRGYKQTSLRYPRLWAEAFRSFNISPDGKNRILLLGLAGGGVLPALYAAFPGSTVTAVEHDETMVSIAHALKLNGPHPFPTVIVADAKEALTRLEEAFDIIAVDLFLGMQLPSFMEEVDFWESVRTRLTPNGVVVVNLSAATYKGEAAKKIFTRSQTAQVEENTFVLYEP